MPAPRAVQPSGAAHVLRSGPTRPGTLWISPWVGFQDPLIRNVSLTFMARALLVKASATSAKQITRSYDHIATLPYNTKNKLIVRLIVLLWKGARL